MALSWLASVVLGNVVVRLLEPARTAPSNSLVSIASFESAPNADVNRLEFVAAKRSFCARYRAGLLPPVVLAKTTGPPLGELVDAGFTASWTIWLPTWKLL